MKIARNDTVEVIAGADKGKTGRVIRVFPDSDRLLVEKVRLAKRHKKQIKGQAGGGIVEMEMPIHVSNVKLVSRGSGRGGKE
jgi:large subunit ribosomal protein L24